MLYGLKWYTAYYDEEIVAVYQSAKIAEAHCKILSEVLLREGRDDEALKVVPVVKGEGDWFVEA